MLKNSELYYEVSKRIDGVEGMVATLNDRLYESDKAQSSIVVSSEKIIDQLTIIFNKLKKNDEKINEIENTISPIKLVKSHWKLIMWIVFTSSSLGFAFDGGIKSIVHAVDKYSISNSVQNVMRNERNDV